MGRAPAGRPTSIDIAYLAGVSQPTVSRALRGDKSVSAATRERIRKIAEELNYTVDRNASSLRSHRSNTIALLFFEDPTSDDSMINPFFLAMLGSITRACVTGGLDLLISFQNLHDNWPAQYRDGRADGLILLGYGDYLVYRDRLRELDRQGTHYVCWGSIDDEQRGPTIGSDNIGAGRQAGAHLIELGRQRIAFLGNVGEGSPEFAERYRGLCEALGEAGLPVEPALRQDAAITEEAGYRAAMRLIDAGARFDGIFAASDLIAIGAMRALEQAGLSVPADVAVIGFDDIPAASLASPPLTTIMQDMKGAGERLVGTLLAGIEDRDPPKRCLPTRLVVRASTVAG